MAWMWPSSIDSGELASGFVVGENPLPVSTLNMPATPAADGDRYTVGEPPFAFILLPLPVWGRPRGLALVKL